jgi:tRNA modification GTPase
MLPSPSTTRVIELTPPGRAAVAVVLVAGPDAVRVVDECFQRADGRRLADMRADRIALGRWGSPGGEELIACRRADGTVEIHCHGGVAAIRAVIDSLTARGCKPTRWQDRLRETATDPIRAAAHVALAEAPTARTAGILLDQYHGALATAIRAALAAATAGDWHATARALDAVLACRAIGLHLTSPWRVVLAGPPNVGKSSLLNALVGFQRAIVCDVPGTTRDVVTATTAIDGWPIQLADTAGLRSTRDAVESAGVERAAAAIVDADLVLLIDDALDGPEASPPNSPAMLRVLNKIDLLPQAPQNVADRWDRCTSAITGAGIGELVAAIGRALVPSPPPAGAAVPFTLDQLQRCDAARAAIARCDAAAIAARLQPLLSTERSA